VVCPAQLDKYGRDGDVEELELLVSNPFGEDGLCLAHIKVLNYNTKYFKNQKAASI
jgi:hypothetical protein